MNPQTPNQVPAPATLFIDGGPDGALLVNPDAAAAVQVEVGSRAREAAAKWANSGLLSHEVAQVPIPAEPAGDLSPAAARSYQEATASAMKALDRKGRPPARR